MSLLTEKFNYLVLPGYGGSGEEHWQSLWESIYPEFTRVQQSDWDNPSLEAWLKNLTQVVEESSKPVVLIAHSLACPFTAHFAKTNPKNVQGAFFVAPADVDDKEKMPKEILEFSPIPTELLPFKSLVITSNNDFYVSSKRAEELAKSWGSEFINIGDLGHINGESNIGDWLEGRVLFERFVKSL